MQTVLPHRFILDTGLIGSYADHQLTRTYHNDYIYGTTTRPYPGFGQVDYKYTPSTMATLPLADFAPETVSLRRKRPDQLPSGRTRSNNGTTGGGESDYPNNDQCLDCEYASNDQDARHVILADAIYTLPVGCGQHFLNYGTIGDLLGGISINSIYTFRSGLPINIVLDQPQSEILDGNNTDHKAGQPNLRPDLVPGVSLPPPEG